MKYKIISPFLLLCLLLTTTKLGAQDCEQHHMVGDCQYDIQRGFKVYSQSTSVRLSPLDTIQLSAVFYGQQDYIISFCTHRKLYPVHLY